MKIKNLVELIENDKTISGLQTQLHGHCKKKKFYGFTNNKEFKFIRLLFDNTKSLYKFTKKFNDSKIQERMKRIDRTYKPEQNI